MSSWKQRLSVFKLEVLSKVSKKILFNLLKMEEVHVSKASRLLIGGYGQCFSSFGFGLTTSGHMSSCQLVGVKYDVALSSRILIPQSHKTSIFSPMWRRHRSAPDGTWREGEAWDVQSPPLRPDWIRDERNIKFCVSWHLWQQSLVWWSGFTLESNLWMYDSKYSKFAPNGWTWRKVEMMPEKKGKKRKIIFSTHFLLYCDV